MFIAIVLFFPTFLIIIMTETRFDVGMTWSVEMLCNLSSSFCGSSGDSSNRFIIIMCIFRTLLNVYENLLSMNYYKLTTKASVVSFCCNNYSEGCANAVKRILGKVDGEYLHLNNEHTLMLLCCDFLYFYIDVHQKQRSSNMFHTQVLAIFKLA